MKEHKKYLIIGFVLGALLAFFLTFIFFRNKLRSTQAYYQILQSTREGVLIDSMRAHDMGNLIRNALDKVDDELKNNPKRILSEETISRIAALSYSLKPFAKLDGDTLSGKNLSPERGQLLLMLSKISMDTSSLHQIWLKADFSHADLKKSDLTKADLLGVNLKGADLQEANLMEANLTGADLSLANLWGANMSKANMNGTVLKRSNLQWADLDEADLKNANLNGADLTSAQLRNTEFVGATMIWANASFAMLNTANFESVDLIGTNFTRANLSESNLKGANLARANLTETNLSTTDLSEVELMKVIVSEENWLDLLNGWNVTGAVEIKSKYKIVRDQSNTQIRYRLEKIEEIKSNN